MVDVHAKPREVAEERRPRVLLGDRRGDNAQQVEGGGRGAADDQHAHGREPPRLVAARVADHEHEQHAFHEQQCRRERRHRNRIVADDDRADEADEAGVWMLGADDHDGECGGRCCPGPAAARRTTGLPERPEAAADARNGERPNPRGTRARALRRTGACQSWLLVSTNSTVAIGASAAVQSSPASGAIAEVTIRAATIAIGIHPVGW